MKTPDFLAGVSAEAKLQMDAETKRALSVWLRTLVGKRVDVVIREHVDTRSLRANAYYWSEVMGEAERANIGYTAEEFHELMLEKFSTRKHYEIVNRQTGEVVEEYDITERSRTMKGKNFYEFVEKVRQFLVEFFGVQTADPDPEYWRKRMAA